MDSLVLKMFFDIERKSKSKSKSIALSIVPREFPFQQMNLHRHQNRCYTDYNWAIRILCDKC